MTNSNDNNSADSIHMNKFEEWFNQHDCIRFDTDKSLLWAAWQKAFAAGEASVLARLPSEHDFCFGIAHALNVKISEIKSTHAYSDLCERLGRDHVESEGG